MGNRKGLPRNVFIPSEWIVRTKKRICICATKCLHILTLCLSKDIKLRSIFNLCCVILKKIKKINQKSGFYLVVCERAFTSQCKSYAAHCMKLCLRHVTYSSIQCHFFLSSSMFTMIFVYMYPAWLRCVSCLGGRWNIIGLAVCFVIDPQPFFFFFFAIITFSLLHCI